MASFLTGSTGWCGDVIVDENITYGTAGTVELKLDLARPGRDGLYPAIVFIHGGGWHRGDRQTYRRQIREAAAKGYVAVTIDYRLMEFDEAKKESTTAALIFPAQIHDAKAAVRWLRAHANEYYVDPGRIGVTGASAGGHLALLVGRTDQTANLEGESGNPEYSSQVQAVVNVYGPTDLTGCYKKSTVAWIFRLFMGGTPDEVGERYRAASPITYASKEDPPVTIHGDQDALVPVAQAMAIDARMKAAGAPHQLIVFKGQRHGFQDEYQRKAMDAMWGFFDQHLK